MTTDRPDATERALRAAIRDTTTRPPRDRPAERDRSKTGRVAGAALRLARGARRTAAARLRLQAAEAARAAAVAIDGGAGDERAGQLLENAARRLRAAGGLERGEW